MTFRLTTGTLTSLGMAALGVLLVPLGACALIGVEPDEIDIADESGDGGTGADSGSDLGEETGQADTDTADQGGDGDGDPGDGDGDGDPAGDGDGDPVPCADLEATELSLGPNPVTIDPGASLFDGECGASGPEAVFRFQAGVGVNLNIALIDPDFTGVLSILEGEICLPPTELDCTELPAIGLSLAEGEVIHVVVDAVEDTGGTATLEVTSVP